jgi:hypothetical protein
MTMRDRDALDRAWEICVRTQNRGEQLPYIARIEGRRAARVFAAGCAQHAALGLKPWETAPCHGEPGGDRPEDKLLDQLLAAGLSRYEPDPLAALERAKKGKKRDHVE